VATQSKRCKFEKQYGKFPDRDVSAREEFENLQIKQAVHWRHIVAPNPKHILSRDCTVKNGAKNASFSQLEGSSQIPPPNRGYFLLAHSIWKVDTSVRNQALKWGLKLLVLLAAT
jgi:hypothetical protein